MAQARVRGIRRRARGDPNPSARRRRARNQRGGSMKRLLVPLLLFAVSAQAQDEVKRLHDLFDRNWEQRLKESPQFATSVGRHEYDALLGSVTPADLARRQEQRKKTLAELLAIDRSTLPEADRVNYDIFRRQVEEGIESYELGDYQMP